MSHLMKIGIISNEFEMWKPVTLTSLLPSTGSARKPSPSAGPSPLLKRQRDSPQLKDGGDAMSLPAPAPRDPPRESLTVQPGQTTLSDSAFVKECTTFVRRVLQQLVPSTRRSPPLQFAPNGAQSSDALDFLAVAAALSLLHTFSFEQCFDAYEPPPPVRPVFPGARVRRSRASSQEENKSTKMPADKLVDDVVASLSDIKQSDDTSKKSPHEVIVDDIVAELLGGDAEEEDTNTDMELEFCSCMSIVCCALVVYV